MLRAVQSFCNVLNVFIISGIGGNLLVTLACRILEKYKAENNRLN